ncbi:hypothetical protein HaloA020_12240 [Halomonas sp. A020]|nr:hypothetical protein HaloA020_12240 [Halomonas sp. A020]
MIHGPWVLSLLEVERHYGTLPKLGKAASDEESARYKKPLPKQTRQRLDSKRLHIAEVML